jgi:hypothetical protein
LLSFPAIADAGAFVAKSPENKKFRKSTESEEAKLSDFRRHHFEITVKICSLLFNTEKKKAIMTKQQKIIKA